MLRATHAHREGLEARQLEVSGRAAQRPEHPCAPMVHCEVGGTGEGDTQVQDGEPVLPLKEREG